MKLSFKEMDIHCSNEGANVGQVILNQTITLQGINNPNLQPAFEAVRDMLHNNN